MLPQTLASFALPCQPILQSIPWEKYVWKLSMNSAQVLQSQFLYMNRFRAFPCIKSGIAREWFLGPSHICLRTNPPVLEPREEKPFSIKAERQWLGLGLSGLGLPWSTLFVDLPDAYRPCSDLRWGFRLRGSSVLCLDLVYLLSFRKLSQGLSHVVYSSRQLYANHCTTYVNSSFLRR